MAAYSKTDFSRQQMTESQEVYFTVPLTSLDGQHLFLQCSVKLVLGDGGRGPELRGDRSLGPWLISRIRFLVSQLSSRSVVVRRYGSSGRAPLLPSTHRQSPPRLALYISILVEAHRQTVRAASLIPTSLGENEMSAQRRIPEEVAKIVLLLQSEAVWPRSARATDVVPPLAAWLQQNHLRPVLLRHTTRVPPLLQTPALAADDVSQLNEYRHEVKSMDECPLPCQGLADLFRQILGQQTSQAVGSEKGKEKDEKGSETGCEQRDVTKQQPGLDITLRDLQEGPSSGRSPEPTPRQVAPLASQPLRVTDQFGEGTVMELGVSFYRHLRRGLFLMIMVKYVIADPRLLQQLPRGFLELLDPPLRRGQHNYSLQRSTASIVTAKATKGQKSGCFQVLFLAVMISGPHHHHQFARLLLVCQWQRSAGTDVVSVWEALSLLLENSQTFLQNQPTTGHLLPFLRSASDPTAPAHPDTLCLQPQPTDGRLKMIVSLSRSSQRSSFCIVYSTAGVGAALVQKEGGSRHLPQGYQFRVTTTGRWEGNITGGQDQICAGSFPEQLSTNLTRSNQVLEAGGPANGAQGRKPDSSRCRALETAPASDALQPLRPHSAGASTRNNGEPLANTTGNLRNEQNLLVFRQDRDPMRDKLPASQDGTNETLAPASPQQEGAKPASAENSSMKIPGSLQVRAQPEKQRSDPKLARTPIQRKVSSGRKSGRNRTLDPVSNIAAGGKDAAPGAKPPEAATVKAAAAAAEKTSIPLEHLQISAKGMNVKSPFTRNSVSTSPLSWSDQDKLETRLTPKWRREDHHDRTLSLLMRSQNVMPTSSSIVANPVIYEPEVHPVSEQAPDIPEEEVGVEVDDGTNQTSRFSGVQPSQTQRVVPAPPISEGVQANNPPDPLSAMGYSLHEGHPRGSPTFGVTFSGLFVWDHNNASCRIPVSRRACLAPSGSFLYQDWARVFEATAPVRSVQFMRIHPPPPPPPQGDPAQHPDDP